MGNCTFTLPLAELAHHQSIFTVGSSTEPGV